MNQMRGQLLHPSGRDNDLEGDFVRLIGHVSRLRRLARFEATVIRMDPNRKL